jgi:hypothetical protein
MTHLLLTVGTGTAGRYSSLADGLVAAVRQADPVRVSLAPSSSPDSRAIAELVRDAFPDRFDPASPHEPFWVLQKPDDILQCRADLRGALHALRGRLPPDGKLLVNPTSGTKQMSAAAVLAALDEEIGEITFTVGERADGVVKTGTERPASFSTAGFFTERDRSTARALCQAGAFRAAERLLARATDPASQALLARARCARDWHRHDYAAAARAAAFSPALAAHLRRLQGAANQDPHAPILLADLLAGAEDLLQRWEEPEEALTRLYKTLEFAATARLAAHLGQPPPFPHARLTGLSFLRDDTRRRLYAQPDGFCRPGLRMSLQILQEGDDPLGVGYFEDRRLPDLMRRRNEHMHDLSAVDPAQAAAAAQRLFALLTSVLPDLPLAEARALRRSLAWDSV